MENKIVNILLRFTKSIGVNMKHKLLLFADHWISSWADMICGFLSVVTFTLYRPWWDFKVRAWFAKWHLTLRKGTKQHTTGKGTQ